MNVLITGSSGQIGTNLAQRLASCGHTALGIDTRPNPWAEVPTELIDLVEVSSGELQWRPSMPPDCIVHLAAWAKVHELVLEPHRAIENVTMAFGAFELARQLDCPLIFGSSREVYGDVRRELTSESAADFVVAESPYSASKLAGEALLASYGRCYKLPYLTLRFSNVYGRFDNDLERMERVVPLFVRSIADGSPITVYGPDKILDFTHVDDCVAGVHAAVERLVSGDVVNQTINLASGHGSSLLDLVAHIEQQTGVEAIVTTEDARRGEVTRYVADLTLAREKLGYEPRYTLSEGIAEYVTWCRASGWL